MTTTPPTQSPSREQIVHALYEAAELEHNLMCTYLYAAFSLRDGPDDGLKPHQDIAVALWRSAIMQVAIEEMGHLAAVWNITVALGAAPRVGRTNFPLDAGYLPAGIVVKLAPFNAQTLQHFIFLERPEGSDEPEGPGFGPERAFVRGNPAARLTPMSMDYATVGEFYASLKASLVAFVGRVGEAEAFRGDPNLQLPGADYGMAQAMPVRCLKTALAALDSIVAQGEGSQADATNSHYQRFRAIRVEFDALRADDPGFEPAFPAATNPVLRRPPRPEGRVWIEQPQAVATVDLANAAYGLMLRLLAYAYSVPGTDPARRAVIELAIGLMHAVVPLGQHATRLEAGPSSPGCHAGMSFTTLRDSAALPAGAAAQAFFSDRLSELSDAAHVLAAMGAPALATAEKVLSNLAARANVFFQARVSAHPPAPAPATAPETITDGVEIVAGSAIEVQFQAVRCIHSRFCVTGAPAVFLANVQGPWIHPDAMPIDRLVEVAHACPSGAIRYRRLDGAPNETAPPVNLAAIREAGPYAFRGELRIDGRPAGYRVTLCRCGASKHKPYCDGSHHDVGFAASGEPPSAATDALAVRDGVLSISPEPNGPLTVEGNLELTTGTGRVVARIQSGRLCRCGGSANKPFCDGTHARIGFRS